MHRYILGVAIAALVATSATAQVDLTRSASGYTYFHRAGATLELHDAAVRRCLDVAAAFDQPDTSAGAGAGGGLIGALVVGIVKGVMEGVAERRGAVANVENCMVVDGWGVVRMPEADGVAIFDLPQPELASRLGPLVGAEPAQGAVMRTFGNDAASPSTTIYAPAGDLDKLSLSIKALAPLEKEPAPKAGTWRMAKSAYPAKPLKPGALAEPPSGYGLVVVRVTDDQSHGRALAFARQGERPDVPAWIDGKPGAFSAKLPTTWTGRSKTPDETFVYAVPAGRWSLSGMGEGLFGVSFCLGAPAFDLAPGEVVFAGTFDVDAEALGPDLAIEPARAALAAAPAIAERVRPAAYVNGVTSECKGVGYAYALEAPGAAWAEGYAAGSLAKAPKAAAEVAASPPAPSAPTAPAADPAAAAAPATATLN